MQPLDSTVVAPLEATPTPTPRMSYEQFLEWEHNGLTEWVNGEMIASVPKHEHQQVVEFLYFVLQGYVQILKLALVRVAPFVMRSAQ